MTVQLPITLQFAEKQQVSSVSFALKSLLSPIQKLLYVEKHLYVLVLNGFSAYKLTETISLLVREQSKNFYMIILVPDLSVDLA